MAKIVVEIDCEDKVCDVCYHQSMIRVGDLKNQWQCFIFDKILEMGKGKSLRRLPECLAAEVKED